MSERTLQRRIIDEGTALSAFLVKVRQQSGRPLLLVSSMGIDEVACLVGYDGTSSFDVELAYGTGTTPSHWRALHAEETPNGR